jgi:4,5-DOPA dioxygenase extradiol
VGVTSAARPRLLFDFSGFPEALYQIRWPAPGAPDVAARAAAVLEAAGFRARLDPQRGLDHGAWVPLRILFPDADVPVVQAALPQLPPEGLVRFGAALAPLRGEGVLLVASGGLVHNLGRVRLDDPEGPVEPWAAAFDAWVAERLARGDVAALLRWREQAPAAVEAAPTSEHLDPLFVALGARAGDDRYQAVHASVQYRNLGMRAFALLPVGAPSSPSPQHERSPQA